jgi:pSer/pThr/pTyr-binding forkhead associated (FHA) protein
MDDLHPSAPSVGLPAVEASAAATNGDDEGAGFIPLRLVLPGGRAVELNRPEVVIGRHSEADVRLHLPDVSRRHCRFVFSEGRWQVFDLHSLNGLFVNDEQVQQATIQHRDVIRIGSYTFEVDLQKGWNAGALPGDAAAASALRRQAS